MLFLFLTEIAFFGSFFRRKKNSVFLGKNLFFLLSIDVIIFLFFSEIITIRQV